MPKYFRERQIQQIVKLARDAMSNECASNKLIIVSGGPRSGRSRVMDGIARKLRRERWKVFDRSVELGQLSTYPMCPELAIDGGMQVAKAVGAATDLVAPMAGGLIILGTEIAATLRMLAPELQKKKTLGDPHLAVLAFSEVLKRAAGMRPVALLIDDADKLYPPRAWWDGFIATTLVSIVEEYPVFVVLSVDNSAPVRDSHAQELLRTYLIKTDRALDFELAPIEPRSVADGLDEMDRNLAEVLAIMGRGRPEWVSWLFDRWKLEGIVAKNRVWNFSSGGYALARRSQAHWVETIMKELLPDYVDFFAGKGGASARRVRGRRIHGRSGCRGSRSGFI